ncbi:HEAT repeat domain-containing protein, partial [bacterium]|nr:HEAT repeat domain-containing protein [bacterium]
MKPEVDITKLKYYARSEEKKLRKQAAISFGKMNDPEAKKILIELSEDEDISVRYFAKRSLRQFEINHQKPEKRVNLEDLEPDSFMKAKLTQLYSPKKEERIKASRIIEEIGDHSVLPEIIDILNKEKDPVITSNLISIIGKLGGNDEIELLKKFLTNKSDSRVRANSIEAIGNIQQDAEIFKLIAPFIKDKNPRVVGNCAKILWNYSREKTILLLKNMLDSDNKDFVWSALYACGELPSLETRLLIISVFKHPDLNYQLRAAKTLKKIDESLFDD